MMVLVLVRLTVDLDYYRLKRKHCLQYLNQTRCQPNSPNNPNSVIEPSSSYYLQVNYPVHALFRPHYADSVVDCCSFADLTQMYYSTDDTSWPAANDGASSDVAMNDAMNDD